MFWIVVFCIVVFKRFELDWYRLITLDLWKVASIDEDV